MSWRVDETYVKVRGQWTYLYRAVDKFGQYRRLLFVSHPQCQNSQEISSQCLERPERLGRLNHGQHRHSANLWYCHHAIEGRRQILRLACAPAGKYLNNIIEADLNKLKQLIRPARGGQDSEIGLCDDQRVRGYACSAQRTGCYL